MRPPPQFVQIMPAAVLASPYDFFESRSASAQRWMFSRLVHEAPVQLIE